MEGIVEMVALHQNILHFYNLLPFDFCHCHVRIYLVPPQHRLDPIDPYGSGFADIIGSGSLQRNLELAL